MSVGLQEPSAERVSQRENEQQYPVLPRSQGRSSQGLATEFGKVVTQVTLSRGRDSCLIGLGFRETEKKGNRANKYIQLFPRRNRVGLYRVKREPFKDGSLMT